MYTVIHINPTNNSIGNIVIAMNCYKIARKNQNTYISKSYLAGKIPHSIYTVIVCLCRLVGAIYLVTYEDVMDNVFTSMVVLALLSMEK